MLKLARAKLKALDLDARDYHAYGGVLLVGLGCAMYAPAASLIVVGVALFYLATRKAA